MRSTLITGLIASVAFGAMTIGTQADETHDWTGPYIGAIVGLGTIDASARVRNNFNNLTICVLDSIENECSPSSLSTPLDDSGFQGGVSAGWNFQQEHIVYGLVGDVSFGDVDQSVSSGIGYLPEYPIGGDAQSIEAVPVKAEFINGFSSEASVKSDLFATVRGRVGVAASDLLLYSTAGLAILSGSAEVVSGGRLLCKIPCDGPGSSKSYTALGPVVGAGAELAINENLSFKAELLYAFFDEKISFNKSDWVKINDYYSARFGANWHF